jgi:hypothetical protein
MSDPFADWPPIITAARRPRLILLRDTLLTLLMWLILFAILYTELEFALSALAVLLGRSEAQIDAELELFFRRMQPLLWLIGGLVTMLALATIASRRRRVEALVGPQPSPLPQAELAAIAGMDEAALAASHTIRRMVVHRDGTALRVEALADRADAG